MTNTVMSTPPAHKAKSRERPVPTWAITPRIQKTLGKQRGHSRSKRKPNGYEPGSLLTKKAPENQRPQTVEGQNRQREAEGKQRVVEKDAFFEAKEKAKKLYSPNASNMPKYVASQKLWRSFWA